MFFHRRCEEKTKREWLESLQDDIRTKLKQPLLVCVVITNVVPRLFHHLPQMKEPGYEVVLTYGNGNNKPFVFSHPHFHEFQGF